MTRGIVSRILNVKYYSYLFPYELQRAVLVKPDENGVFKILGNAGKIEIEVFE